MLKAIAIGFAAAAAALAMLVAYATTRPDTFIVSRSLTIMASPETLFTEINDLRRFNVWNPFERKDPGKGAHSGAATGPGARYAWDSNKVGKGSMTIASSEPGKRVTMDLAFLTPFKADNLADFTLTPNPEGTLVTWTMRGEANLMSKVMDVVIGMDRMVGSDFAVGLVNLKTLVETGRSSSLD